MSQFLFDSQTNSFFIYRHQPSLIPTNPDAPPPDVYLLEYQLPKWCQAALTQPEVSKSPSKRQSTTPNTSLLNVGASTSLNNSITLNKARVHACRALLKTAEERPDLRRAMILSRGLIETIVLILQEEESNAHAVRRCQHLLLNLLSTLLLSDPLLDQYIIFEPGLTDAIANQLLNSDRDIQTSISVVFDYICVAEENRTHVCGTDHMLFGVVQLLHNTKSIDAREHALQGLLYLSEISENRFIIARQAGLLEALTISLFYQQVSIPMKSLQILHNLALLKENIPYIAKQKELRERIQIILLNAKVILKRNNLLDPSENDIENENDEEVQSFQSAPQHFDTLSKDEPADTPCRFEKEIYRISMIILQLVFRYDTRYNSKLILEGTDYNSQRKLFVPNPKGEFISSSILENYYKRNQVGNTDK